MKNETPQNKTILTIEGVLGIAIREGLEVRVKTTKLEPHIKLHKGSLKNNPARITLFEKDGTISEYHFKGQDLVKIIDRIPDFLKKYNSEGKLTSPGITIREYDSEGKPTFSGSERDYIKFKRDAEEDNLIASATKILENVKTTRQKDFNLEVLKGKKP